MKKFSGLALGAILLLGVPFPAHASADGQGTFSGEFLKQPVGARAVAMGEAYTALVNDASAVFWNPSALTRVKGRSLFLIYSSLLDSVNMEVASYSQGLGSLGALGTGIQYMDEGSIQQTDASGAGIGGALNPHDIAATLSYALAMGKHSLGVSGKFISSKLVDTAETFSGDVGYSSPILWGGRMRLAAVAQNLGGKLTYDQAGEKLPRIFRLGSAIAPRRDCRFGLDIILADDNKTVLALGAERILDWGGYELAGRMGYNTRSTGGDLGGLSGFSLGLGVGNKSLSLDYALVLFGDLGAAHRVSLSVRL